MKRLSVLCLAFIMAFSLTLPSFAKIKYNEKTKMYYSTDESDGTLSIGSTAFHDDGSIYGSVEGDGLYMENIVPANEKEVENLKKLKPVKTVKLKDDIKLYKLNNENYFLWNKDKENSMRIDFVLEDKKVISRAYNIKPDTYYKVVDKNKKEFQIKYVELKKKIAKDKEKKEKPFEIYFNGKKAKIEDTIIRKDGRTYVPLRFVSENLGVEIIWNQKDKSIDLTDSDLKVHMKIGSYDYTVNDDKKKMDKEPFLSGSKTYVPIRFIAEALNKKVDWDQKNNAVMIENIKTNEPKSNDLEKYIPKDKNEFEKIIYKDILNEDYDKNLYPVILIDKVKTVPEKDYTKVFANIWMENFSFDKPKFKAENGFSIFFRYDIDKNGKIIKKWTPEDGENYKSSILKMTENDKSVLKEMEKISKDENINKKQMAELKRVALLSGLKEEDFSFKIDKIPGYEKDVIYLKNKDRCDIEKGLVCLIKKQDYDDLQKERKEIVPSDKAGKHWVYRECILYDENTGIVKEFTLDYSK